MGKKSVNKRKSLPALLVSRLFQHEVSSVLDRVKQPFNWQLSCFYNKETLDIRLLLLGDIPPSPGDIPRELHKTLMNAKLYERQKLQSELPWFLIGYCDLIIENADVCD